MKPFLDSTRFINDGTELKRRMDREGYLYLCGVLPADILEDLRLQFLRIAYEGGWVRRDTPLEDAIADLSNFCAEPQPKYNQVYMGMYKIQAFHAIQHHRNLVAILERLLAAPVLPHPRLIGRTIFPRKEAFTTPPHQDFIPIQGTADTITAWVPLSDLPAEMGGLQLSSGSHRRGIYEFRPATGAGGMKVIDPLEGTWVNSPMSQGDVILFHSMAVHKGVACQGQRLRMSLDARYQRISDPMAPDSLRSHLKDDLTWEEIYANWPNDEYQYYWKKHDLTFKEYDYSYNQKRDEMAFEMAENGDDEARGTLDRIAARDRDPQKRQKARALLELLDAKASQS